MARISDTLTDSPLTPYYNTLLHSLLKLCIVHLNMNISVIFFPQGNESSTL